MFGDIRSAGTALGVLAMLGAAGCSADPERGDTEGAGATRAAAAAPAGRAGMQGMPGMSGMRGSGMMADMQAYMDSTASVTAGDRLEHMLPMHRQMTANMLAGMNREMQSMNMRGDAAWTALMDSVRQDLRTLPEMSRAQLTTAVPPHRARVLRLMEMHRTMMKGM